jgi:hypothetical protein
VVVDVVDTLFTGVLLLNIVGVDRYVKATTAPISKTTITTIMAIILLSSLNPPI